MSFARPAEPYEVNPKLVRALDRLLILHADDEQNCLHRDCPAGRFGERQPVRVHLGRHQCAAGPLHGGADRAVLEMLERIRRDGGDVTRFVERVKNKEPGVRLMGFGHRVYKNYDPRAALVKSSAREVIDDLGAEDELLDLAQQLEAVALSDDYFPVPQSCIRTWTSTPG